MTDSTIETANVVQGNNEFALDLYTHLARCGSTNLFFSPYSISTALAMTFAGARGNTEVEMAAVLQYRLGQQRLHSHLGGLTKAIFGSEHPSYEIEIANRIWGQVGYEFRPEFLELLRTEYGADIEQLDFINRAVAASQHINRWVENQTAGKITDLVSPDLLTTMTQLLLTNAVYFKGDWTTKFDKAATKVDSFQPGAAEKVQVQMMHQQTPFPYAEVGGVQLIVLPYGNRDLSMVVLLPTQPSGITDLESALSSESLNRWLTSLVQQEVKVYLPRFRLTEQLGLADVLRSMGMTSAFSDTEADFSGMSDQKPGLYIFDVIHKAYLEVNEDGTEATAASAVVTGYVGGGFHASSVPPVFRADHPFMFAILHNVSGSILFMGRVMNPLEGA